MRPNVMEVHVIDPYEPWDTDEETEEVILVSKFRCSADQ